MSLKYSFLEHLAAEYGAINLRFFVPMQVTESLHMMGLPCGMTNGDSPYVEVECEVDESRYKMADGYKIALKPVVQELIEGRFYFAGRDYYQMDFINMIERDPDEFRIYVLVDEDNKYQRLNYSR